MTNESNDEARMKSGYAAVSTSGCFFAISSKRNAAPEGLRLPFSQLTAVTVGTLRIAANTGWLTFIRERIF